MSGAPNTDTGVVTPPPVTPPPVGSDWISSLPPELKQVVEVKGYKTPADVVQGYANAQKAIGADKIMLPNKDTGEWDAEARIKLGVPVDATGYQIKRPESLPQGMVYDEGFEKAALPIAHKLGLTPHQVNGLMEFYATHQGEAFKTMTVEATQALANAQALLKKEWGTTYDSQTQRAQIAAKHFGGDALITYLNATGMGNAPEVIRAFAKIGAMMTEDQLKVGQSSGFGLTPVEAEREARKIMATEAYQKREHPEHAEAQEKVAALFAQAHPD
jgi:hypothetical protein